jgi:hypothetical protein
LDEIIRTVAADLRTRSFQDDAVALASGHN